MAQNRSRSNNRGNDDKPSFPFGQLRISGNLTRDPNEMGKDGNACGLTVAANYRDSYRDDEGVFFVGVTVSGGYAQWALDNLKKGDRVTVIGNAYGNYWEENDEQNIQINWADFIGPDYRFYGSDGGGEGGGRGGRSRGSGSGRGSGRGSSRSRGSRNQYDDDNLGDDGDDGGAERTRRPAPDRRRRRRPVSETEN